MLIWATWSAGDTKIRNKHKNKFTKFHTRPLQIYVKRTRKIISYLNLIVVPKDKESCVISSRHFQAFVHISTAYCQCEQPVLEEVLYPSPNDPQAILQLVEWMDDDILDSITPKWVQRYGDVRDAWVCMII